VCLFHGATGPHFACGTFGFFTSGTFGSSIFGALGTFISGAESILKVADTHWPSSASQSLIPPGQLVQSPTDLTSFAKGGLQSVVYVSPTFEYWQRQALPPSPGIGNFALHARILQAWHMDLKSLTLGSKGVCLFHGATGPHFNSGAFGVFSFGRSGLRRLRTWNAEAVVRHSAQRK